MIERIAGCLAVATAGVGLWMAIGHVRGLRSRRAVVALHALGAAVLLELVALSAPPPVLAIEIAVVALVSGLALWPVAKRVPEGAGMMIFAHGTVALAAAAIVVAWAVKG